MRWTACDAIETGSSGGDIRYAIETGSEGIMYFAVENDSKKIATQQKIGAACEWRASSRRIVDNELVNAPFRSRTANE
jgi:hypothetical protein